MKKLHIPTITTIIYCFAFIGRRLLFPYISSMTYEIILVWIAFVCYAYSYLHWQNLFQQK